MTRCDVSICHAACCGVVPFTQAQFHGNKHLLQRDVMVEPFVGDTIIAVDKNLVCGFLTQDFKCAIYDNRPDICKMFARKGETHPMLKCTHLEQGFTE